MPALTRALAERAVLAHIPFKERLWCSVAEASQVLGICRTRVFAEISSGAIVSKKEGARRLCSVPSILERFEFEASQAADIRQKLSPFLDELSRHAGPSLSVSQPSARSAVAACSSTKSMKAISGFIRPKHPKV